MNILRACYLIQISLQKILYQLTNSVSFSWSLPILDISVLNRWLLLNTCEHENRVRHFGEVPWGTLWVTGIDGENGHVDLFKWTGISITWKEDADASDHVTTRYPTNTLHRSKCNILWSMTSPVRERALWGQGLSHTCPYILPGPTAGPCTQVVSLDRLSSSWSMMKSLWVTASSLRPQSKNWKGRWPGSEEQSWGLDSGVLSSSSALLTLGKFFNLFESTCLN